MTLKATKFYLEIRDDNHKAVGSRFYEVSFQNKTCLCCSVTPHFQFYTQATNILFLKNVNMCGRFGFNFLRKNAYADHQWNYFLRLFLEFTNF